MKRLLGIAGLLAAAWASPTFAADLPRPAYKAPVYVAPAVYSWTGYYLGVNGGYGWANRIGRAQPPPAASMLKVG